MRPYPLFVRGDPWLYTVARLLLVPAAIACGRFEVDGAGRRSCPSRSAARRKSCADDGDASCRAAGVGGRASA